MRVMITGGSGFLGGHLSSALVKADIKVGAILRQPNQRGKLDTAAQVFEHDGSTEGLHHAVRSFKPDAVVHLASKYLAAHTPADVNRLVESNILFGVQLLDAMAAYGVGRLVNFGTSFQHFAGEGYHPVSLYAATKQAFEDLALYYAEAHGLSVLTLKLSDTYGPGDDRGKIVSLLTRAGRSGEELLLSPGEQIVNFAHSDDVVRAVYIALKRLQVIPKGTVESYAVRGEELLSLREFVALFEEISGLSINANWGARPYRDREVMTPWLGELLPAWQPEIGLRQGLSEVLNV